MNLFTIVIAGLLVNIAWSDVDSIENSCVMSASHNDISNVLNLIEAQDDRIKTLESLVNQLSSCEVVNIPNSNSGSFDVVKNGESITFKCSDDYSSADIMNRKCVLGKFKPSFIDSPLKCKRNPPKYFYVDTRLGWKASQKYCKEKYNGNLATHGLETKAGRIEMCKKLNLTSTDVSLGFHKEFSEWARIDGSVLDPPHDGYWFPDYPRKNVNYDFMRCVCYDDADLGKCWNHKQNIAYPFVCESYDRSL